MPRHDDKPGDIRITVPRVATPARADCIRRCYIGATHTRRSGSRTPGAKPVRRATAQGAERFFSQFAVQRATSSSGCAILSTTSLHSRRTFLPFDLKHGVERKFKEIPKQLHKDGLIKRSLDCGGPEFQRFQKLIEYRDGLVHATASRFETTGRPSRRATGSVEGRVGCPATSLGSTMSLELFSLSCRRILKRHRRLGCQPGHDGSSGPRTDVV